MVWRCAVPSPLRQLLDYLPATGADVSPGCRVRVPLGRRSVIAVVMEVTSTPSIDPAKLRPAEAVLDDEPLVNSTLLALVAWVAHYYVHPPGEVAPLTLGPRERRGEPPAATGEPGLVLSIRGKGLPAGALKKAPKQAQLLKQLQQAPQTLTSIKQAGVSSAIIRELLSKSLVERCDLPPDQQWSTNPGLAANPEQQEAIKAIGQQLGRFGCHVLQGSPAAARLRSICSSLPRPSAEANKRSYSCRRSR
jgi:primosomal protein N' (replication factor Y)